jgi:hypothetical protein
MCDAIAHAGKTQRRIVSAWAGTAFAQDDAAGADEEAEVADDPARSGKPRRSAAERSAIVEKRRPAGEAPDLVQEEISQRGDAADALFRELVRRVTSERD